MHVIHARRALGDSRSARISWALSFKEPDSRRAEPGQTPTAPAQTWSADSLSCIDSSLTRPPQIRRQIRERRQYIYAKSLEAQERQTYERKQQLKDALATGRALPTELRKEAQTLGRDLTFDEAQAGACSIFSLCIETNIPLCRPNHAHRQ